MEGRVADFLGGEGHVLRSPGGQALATAFELSPDALAQLYVYPPPDRARLIEQLLLGLRGFYVHLPRKTAIYGHDPVRALELLSAKAAALSDGEFHEALTEIIARIRDRHVMLFGRTPYGASATLPFTIERCWIDGAPTYVVSKIQEGQAPAVLRLGALVTHWNGIPIERFVRLNANLFDGGNDAAAVARSLAFLTSRPLSRFGPPLEDWVDLTFTVDGAVAQARFAWAGLDTANAPVQPAIGRNILGFGGDPQLRVLHQSRRVRFAAASFDAAAEGGEASAGLGGPVIAGSGAGGVFDYGSVTTKDGEFAYLRFWSFQVDGVDDLIDALVPILPTLPQDGLIFDMRGNSGGYIAAGERLLQLFTPRPIVPARFQFRVTEATRRMVDLTDDFARWRAAFVEAFETGEEYTQGFPIEGVDADFNKVGQTYLGPVVLITDALAFSTADIFAAGFMDHRVGRVICTDANMAAAGGNNWWPWDIFRLFNPDFELDAQHRPDLETGTITPALLAAFNASGASLSQQARLSPGAAQYDGRCWTITDGAMRHIIRDLPWLGGALLTYLARSPTGLADMPSGITVSLTIRRSLRVGEQEGRVLEDVGITPDLLYQMTLQDVMAQNQDLFTRAGEVLRES